ncbi:bifunctional riboflavin kinase/FAD synthetase [Vallitalea pronyensis]|uniref:Riboflavin biosynthesis protein n=1 Tax=Vallitalea pronyensis TaxID=1348613 RepID=A0A8J8MJU2_9FIRM|nr:bifunctional riboflavin kinase/FAD synthetase [Vallitalea pronyensis]QUI22995.1 bifunctional riboflavin kinase/FAD synthetase [Vallitalea pronyensis]
MEHITGTKDITSPPSVVVLGNFDGIHIGHRKLIDKALDISKTLDLKVLVFTFDPHPSFVLANKEPVDLIYLSKEKAKLLDDVDYFVEYPYDLDTSRMTPEIFIEEVVCKGLQAKAIVVGEDYRFGYKRKGDIELLKALASKNGYQLITIKKIAYNHRIVSSTWIRHEIKKGHMEKANLLLGSNFSISGQITLGRQNGRKLGFPTANIKPNKNKLLPPNGVYLSKIYVNNIQYNSITNIGINPTLDGNETVVETHILDFNQDIYGQDVTVELLKFVRDEKKFESLHALKKEIAENIAYRRAYMEENHEL